MACILHIETSTNVSSVAVSKDGFRVFEKEDHGEKQESGNSVSSGLVTRSNASEKIGSMVDEAMQAVESKNLKIEAVAVSSGPGSYTGLRIGVSMAKGLAYGSDAKLISVPTLQLLCVPILLGNFHTESSSSLLRSAVGESELPDDALLVPMIDARRMEVFAAVYDRSLKEVRPTQADIVDSETYKDYLDAHPVYFFGNGAGKFFRSQSDGTVVLNHPNAHFIDGIVPLAKNMLPIADQRFSKGLFEDVAYFTPEYHKEYQAKLPKNLLKTEK